MKQSDIFNTLLNRAIAAEVSVAHERARADAAENRLHDVAHAQRVAISVQHVHDLMSAMTRGLKIEAIKLHRTMTGYGLRESKDAVEAVMERVR